MKIKEVRALSTVEIESKMEDSREELFKLRFQYATGQLSDMSRLGFTRQTIARLETVLRERELASLILAGRSAAAESPAPEATHE